MDDTDRGQEWKGKRCEQALSKININQRPNGNMRSTSVRVSGCVYSHAHNRGGRGHFLDHTVNDLSFLEKHQSEI